MSSFITPVSFALGALAGSSLTLVAWIIFIILDEMSSRKSRRDKEKRL